MSTAYKSPIHEMVQTTKTDYWNDSCQEKELEYAIAHGAVGATTNPVIVLNALRAELAQWEDQIRDIIKAHPRATEDDIAWHIIETVAKTRAKFLFPIFEKTNKKKGRLSIQTNPKFFQNTQKLVAQALHFNSIYANNNVKIPVTKAGIDAIEEVTAQGVSINATVSYTVPQAIAVAEAVERGLQRREQAGDDITTMAPVCTIMVGRVDDWFKVVVNRDKLALPPEWLEWGGVAIFKHAYSIYQAKKYRTRLLAAAIRNQYHWSELIGADIVITMPYPWATRFNQSSIPATPRIDTAVNPDYVAGLLANIPDFKRAYDADGMPIAAFDSYGAVRETLRSFLSGYSQLVDLTREYMVPNPAK